MQCALTTRSSKIAKIAKPTEVDAIVDEAHRLGLKVACHAYGGEGMNSCLTAGVDAPNHLLELDDAGVKIMLQRRDPSAASSSSSSVSSSPVMISSPMSPAFCRIAASILLAMSGLALRKSFAFSRPWPMRWLS